MPSYSVRPADYYPNPTVRGMLRLRVVWITRARALSSNLLNRVFVLLKPRVTSGQVRLERSYRVLLVAEVIS